MQRRQLDRAVPLVYVVLVLLAAFLFPVALAPIALIGAVVVAGWFSFVRPMLRARERQRDRNDDAPWFLQ